MKKKLMIILFISIFSVILSTMIYADVSGKCGENITYEYSKADKTITLSGTGEMYDYEAGSTPFKSMSGKVIVGENITGIGNTHFKAARE